MEKEKYRIDFQLFLSMNNQWYFGDTGTKWIAA